jgi:hypothetical protein
MPVSQLTYYNASSSAFASFRSRAKGRRAVEQFALGRLWLGFELHAPIAESLERNPLRRAKG